MTRKTLTRSSVSPVVPAPEPKLGRRRFTRQLWGAAAVLACGAGVGAWWLWSRPWLNAGKLAERAEEKGLPAFGYKVVNTYDHDPKAFTQGLLYHDGVLYESTGQERESTLRRVELTTGKVLDRVLLHRDHFGEGLALLDDELFQLTWQHEICLVYDRKTLREKRRLRFKGEGWGLTHDGTHFILSNGSSTLQFLDSKTFRVVKQVPVKMDKLPVEKLNELEFIDGEIWANVWYEDAIARIDPKSGAVTGVVHLDGLWPQKERPDRDHVLNGIAHDAKKNRLFVTGKYWPKLYEIRLVKN